MTNRSRVSKLSIGSIAPSAERKDNLDNIVANPQLKGYSYMMMGREPEGAPSGEAGILIFVGADIRGGGLVEK